MWVLVANTPVENAEGLVNGWCQISTDETDEQLMAHLHISGVSKTDPSAPEVEETEEAEEETEEAPEESEDSE